MSRRQPVLLFSLGVSALQQQTRCRPALSTSLCWAWAKQRRRQGVQGKKAQRATCREQGEHRDRNAVVSGLGGVRMKQQQVRTLYIMHRFRCFVCIRCCRGESAEAPQACSPDRRAKTVTSHRARASACVMDRRCLCIVAACACRKTHHTECTCAGCLCSAPESGKCTTQHVHVLAVYACKATLHPALAGAGCQCMQDNTPPMTLKQHLQCT